MQIKRFEARDMTTALRLIKEQLGPEAVILSARSIKKGTGIFGSSKNSGVEITAATDIYDAQENKKYISDPKEKYDAVQFKLSKHFPSNKQKRRIQSLRNSKKIPSSGRNPEDRRIDYEPGTEQILFALYQQLVSQDIDSDIALDLTETVKIIPGAKQQIFNGEFRSLLSSLFKHKGLAADPIQLNNEKPKIVALVGTTGVGKTTTIAKLAAHYGIEQEKNVALITLDDLRIAAIEQLTIYAKILGVPLEVATGAHELKRHLKEFKNQNLILIDTPGISQNNHDQINKLINCFEPIKSIEIQLVLSASTKNEDLFHICNSFRRIQVKGLIFTKLDESNSFGNLLNILIRTKIPLSYFSDGPLVPDDIEEGSIRKLAELISVDLQANDHLQKSVTIVAKRDPIQHLSEPGQGKYFVANQNSDVYHAPGCKWVKKIKPKHIIKFVSSEAAEQKNYLPCRNCNPDRPEPFNLSAFERDKTKISTYR